MAAANQLTDAEKKEGCDPALRRQVPTGWRGSKKGGTAAAAAGAPRSKDSNGPLEGRQRRALSA